MATLKLDKHFDPDRCRHYVNNNLTVLHCHHYATLFTQLALDAQDLVNGTKLLYETSEDIFYKTLTDYYKDNGVTDQAEKTELAKEMFSSFGLGKIEAGTLDEKGGSLEMPVAYLDQGWLQKWGKYNSPVNFIGAGYIAAMFSAVFDKPVRSYKVEEQESKVTGASKTVLQVTV